MYIEISKRNKKIAEYATKYLKSRLELSQEYFSIKNSNNCIELKEFMNNIKKINDSINNADNELKIKSLKELKNDYLKVYNTKVIINSKEINELIGIIRYAIENYGVGYTGYACNEEIFIRKILQIMEKQSIASENNSDLNEKFHFWKTFFDLTGNFAFAPELSGRIRVNFRDGDFSIQNSNKDTFCCVNQNGNGRNIFQLEKEDIFFDQNIMVGIQNNAIGLFLKKEEENEMVLKPLKNSKGNIKSVDSKEPIKEITNLNNYLEEIGIINLQSNIYKKNELIKILQTIRNYNAKSVEERAIIRMISTTAADFWKTTIFENDKNTSEEKIERFKDYISGEIMTGLFSGSNRISINTFIEPCTMLKRAMKEIGVEKYIDSGISMDINSNKITVVINRDEKNKRVIFDYDDPLNVTVKDSHHR